VHAMLMRARTCAHVCIRTFLDVFVPNLVETFLCMCYMIVTLAFAHYASNISMPVLHACARSHIFDGFFPNLVEHSTGHRDMHGLLDVYMHDCMCALSAYVYFGDGFTTNLVKTLII
jgi:hypothetical protein